MRDQSIRLGSGNRAAARAYKWKIFRGMPDVRISLVSESISSGYRRRIPHRQTARVHSVPRLRILRADEFFASFYSPPRKFNSYAYAFRQVFFFFSPTKTIVRYEKKKVLNGSRKHRRLAALASVMNIVVLKSRLSAFLRRFFQKK